VNYTGECVRRLTVYLAAAGLLAASAGVASAQPVGTGAALDVGAYPTVPGPPLGIAGSPQAGARVEGRRLADVVVGPWEVDPSLIGKFDTSAVVIDGPEALRAEVPVELADVAVRHQLIDGFATARWADDMELQHIVVRFADPETAATAATEFADALARRKVPGGPIAAAAVPGHPATTAFANPVADADNDRTVTYVRAVTAHGPYVFIQRAMAADGADAASGLVAGILDRQLPVIDQFSLTPPSQLASLPVDPSGLMARTVPLSPEDVTTTLPGSFGPRGALHLQDNPVLSGGVFAETGVSTVAYAATAVYETRDADTARRLVDLLDEEYRPVSTPREPVNGLAGSRCADLAFPNGNTTSHCLAVVDRSVIEAEADTLLDAQQRAAAQSVMLTR
jgi:hypothetical protein